jgi:two-component system, OmpR family, response regulator
MSTIPLASPDLARRPGRRRRRRDRPPPRLGTPPVSLTFDVTLRGPGRADDALAVLAAVRRAVHAVGASVTVIPSEWHGALPPPGAPPRQRPADQHRIRIAADARTVYAGNGVLALTRREFDLLCFLAAHPRQVFTRAQLLRQVWGHEYTGERTIDVHIRRLRAKLGRELVATVRGVGYRLADGAPVGFDTPPRET